MTVSVLLLDADGVLQRMAPSFDDRMAKLTPNPDKAGFVAAVQAADDLCVTGERDLAELLPDVLRAWGCNASIDELFDIWHTIDVDASVVDVVVELRARGVVCCLATNQHPYRAAHMLNSLGYERLLDRQFYSCHMGVAKPDRRYFEQIVEQINVRPEETLFVDDRTVNVEAAIAVGLKAEHFTPHAGGSELRRLLNKYEITGRRAS